MAVPWSTPGDYADWRESKGLPPSALVCEEVWSHQVRVCLKQAQNGKRVWVTTAEVESWLETAESVFTEIRLRAKPYLEETELRRVEDMPVPYLMLRDGVGWGVAALWYPEDFVARLGGKRLQVAMPTDGIVMGWIPGSPEVDTVLAGAARELYDQDTKKHGVTPMVHTWTGTQWLQFGLAKRKEGE